PQGHAADARRAGPRARGGRDEQPPAGDHVPPRGHGRGRARRGGGAPRPDRRARASPPTAAPRAGRCRRGRVRHALVTGCAGFVGSHLCERLTADGWRVTGVDAFTPYYDRAAKEENLAALAAEPRFDLVELDVAEDDLAPLLADAPVVFHLAAQPGVRA